MGEESDAQSRVLDAIEAARDRAYVSLEKRWVRYREGASKTSQCAQRCWVLLDFVALSEFRPLAQYAREPDKYIVRTDLGEKLAKTVESSVDYDPAEGELNEQIERWGLKFIVRGRVREDQELSLTLVGGNDGGLGQCLAEFAREALLLLRSMDTAVNAASERAQLAAEEAPETTTARQSQPQPPPPFPKKARHISVSGIARTRASSMGPREPIADSAGNLIEVTQHEIDNAAMRVIDRFFRDPELNPIVAQEVQQWQRGDQFDLEISDTDTRSWYSIKVRCICKVKIAVHQQVRSARSVNVQSFRSHICGVRGRRPACSHMRMLGVEPETLSEE